MEVEVPEEAETETFGDIEQENWRRIKAMDKYELEKARREIYEKIDPKTIEFLKQRSQEKKPKKGNFLFITIYFNV